MMVRPNNNHHAAKVRSGLQSCTFFCFHVEPKMRKKENNHVT